MIRAPTGPGAALKARARNAAARSSRPTGIVWKRIASSGASPPRWKSWCAAGKSRRWSWSPRRIPWPICGGICILTSSSGSSRRPTPPCYAAARGRCRDALLRHRLLWIGDRRSDMRCPGPIIADRGEEGVEDAAGLERIATSGNREFDLARRQLERRLYRIELRGALRAQLIEREAAEENLHVAATPSRRRAEIVALGGRQFAPPIDQRVLPVGHRVLERRIAADRAGFRRGVGRSRNQIDAGRSLNGLRPCARRRPPGIGDHEQQPAEPQRLLWLEWTIGRGRKKPRDGEAGEGGIVHHAAVEQLDVANFAGVIARYGIGEEPQHRRRIGIGAHAIHPWWQRYRAASRIALDHHGRENNRHRRRSDNRQRNRIARQIAAQRPKGDPAENKRR